MDNWDPAVIDRLASHREVLLFDSAGVGGSNGEVPETVAGMAKHAFAFLDGLGLSICDVLTQGRPGAAFGARGRQGAAHGLPRVGEQSNGKRFAELKEIRQPTLVVNGVHDEMMPVANSYWLSENLPNAVLLTYPDSGHGALFQFHQSFTRQAAGFLASTSPFAPF